MTVAISGLAVTQARIAELQSRFASARPLPVSSGASFDGAFDAALGQLNLAGPTRAVAGASVAFDATGDTVIAAARKYLGVPYVWGGTDPATGLDCSGFVQRVYADLGIDLPRVSKDQARAGHPVASLAEARPGDLVAFDNSAARGGIDHIGIYLGDNKMIVAPRSGDVVKVQEITTPPASIRRILPDAVDAAPFTLPSSADALGRITGTTGMRFAGLFATAGARHGVDPALLAAVARSESGFDPAAVSHAGAQGLMQLMPATTSGLGVNALDPAQAVDGAARLLSGHLRSFGGDLDLALAAYNAGPGAVRRHGGVPPYTETRTYITKVRALLEGTA